MDRLLVWSQVAAAAVVLLTALAVLLRKKLPSSAVLFLPLLSAAVHVMPIRAILASINEAIHRGGDWGGLAVLARQASLVLEIGVTGLCIVTAGYLVYRRKAELSTH
jgi:hypothetical protein